MKIKNKKFYNMDYSLMKNLLRYCLCRRKCLKRSMHNISKWRLAREL